jgi:hypothetical protein
VGGAEREPQLFVSGALASETHDPRVVGVRLVRDPASPTTNLESYARSATGPETVQTMSRSNGHLVSGAALLSKPARRTIRLPPPFKTNSATCHCAPHRSGLCTAAAQVFDDVALNADGSDDSIKVKLGGNTLICLVTTNREVDPSSTRSCSSVMAASICTR